MEFSDAILSGRRERPGFHAQTGAAGAGKLSGAGFWGAFCKPRRSSSNGAVASVSCDSTAMKIAPRATSPSYRRQLGPMLKTAWPDLIVAELVLLSSCIQPGRSSATRLPNWASPKPPERVFRQHEMHRVKDGLPALRCCKARSAASFFRGPQNISEGFGGFRQ